MITIYDMKFLVVDESTECYIFNMEECEEIYNGEIENIPEEYLDLEVQSWELYDGKIGLNVEL